MIMFKHCYDREFLQNLLLKGIDLNIVCYDKENTDNILSLGLIQLMKASMRRIYSAKIKYIYIPKNESILKNSDYLAEYNIKFITMPDMLEFYKSNDAHLLTGKKNIIIACDKNHNNILLGQY